MKISLGTVIPTADPIAMDGGPVVDPGTTTQQAPAPSAPAGYWVNPANPTQWLPPAQAAKIGDVCFFGTGLLPGRLRVGGNQANTQLYCGSFFETKAMDSIVGYGGLAALAWFFLPAPYKYWVSIPLAGFAVLGATLGSVEL